MSDSQPIKGSKDDLAQRGRRSAASLYDPALPMPEAADMERCLLGALMQAPALAPEVMRVLATEDFSVEAHGFIFGMIARRTERGDPVEPPFLVRDLYDQGVADKFGGPGLVSECYAACPNPGHALFYAGHVRDKAVARRVIVAASRCLSATLVQSDRESVEAASLALVDEVLLAVRNASEAQKIVHIRQALRDGQQELESAFQNRGHVLGDTCTGYTSLDRALIKGLVPRSNTVIAGDTGSGKTALAIGILLNMALNRGHYKEFYNWDSSYSDRISDWQAALAEGRGTPRHRAKKVLIVCLEASQTETALQMLLGEAGVDIHNIYGGFMDRQTMPAVERAAESLVQTQVYLWDAPGITVEELAAEVKRFKLQHPDLDVVCVDHMGLLDARGVKDKGNETALAGYVSNSLLRMYQQCNVRGLTLVQLNREAAEKGASGKRPTRAMLRGSGKIEQDADTILMPYRPAHYNPEADPEEAYIVIAKARGCRINLNGVRMVWHGGTKRFLSGYKWTEELHEELKATDFDLSVKLYEKWSYGDIIPDNRLYSVQEENRQVR